MEEYAETEYYKDLNCVDKQHHTVRALYYFSTAVSPNFMNSRRPLVLDRNWIHQGRSATWQSAEHGS